MSVKIDLKVPAYAHKMLWLTSGEYSTNHFEDEVDVPDGNPLLLRWGMSGGSVMARWSTSPVRLSWQGQVMVRGTVEAVHLLTVKTLDLMVVEVIGHVPAAVMPRFPSMADLREQPFERSPFRDSDMLPGWYAFLLPLDSPLGDFAHHSLTHGGSIDVYGTLAEEKSGFHQIIGMPLLMDSLTLFP